MPLAQQTDGERQPQIRDSARQCGADGQRRDRHARRQKCQHQLRQRQAERCHRAAHDPHGQPKQGAEYDELSEAVEKYKDKFESCLLYTSKPRKCHKTQITNRTVFEKRLFSDFSELQLSSFVEMDTVHSVSYTHLIATISHEA